MSKQLMKLAASYLEGLTIQNEELESMVKKAEVIDSIANKLKDQNIIVTLDQYETKVAELKTKTLPELENIKTYLELYAPQAQEEFGKLANYEKINVESLSAEDQFALIMLK